jgi:very-short-patch-repair endonuclease
MHDDSPTEDQLYRIPAGVRARAREMRHQQIPAEGKLWAVLRGGQLHGLKFRRQHPIGRFIADFYCAEARLVIELDGESHAVQQEYDAIRTAYLQAQGYHVIRFTNHDVQSNLEGVALTILHTCGR